MECCSLKQFPPYISCPLVCPRPPPPSPPPPLSIVSSSSGSSSNSLRLSSRTPISPETDLFSRHCSRVSVSAASNCPQSSPISSKGFLPYGRLESGWLSFMELIVDFLLFSPYTISRWCCNGLLHSIYFLIYLHFCRKRIIRSFPYKMLLSAVCLVGFFLSLIIIWDMKRKSEPGINNSPISLTKVAIFHTIGLISETLSLLELSISFSHATNGVEPILVGLLSVILLSESLPAAVSMLLIFGGCALAAGTSLNFTIKGFCAVIIANFIFTFRDVLLEGGMKAKILNGKGKDIWVDYYACLLILSLLIVFPIALTMEEMAVIKEFGMKLLGGVLSIRPVNVLGVLLCILGVFLYCWIFANAKGRDTVMNAYSKLSKGTAQKKKVHKINKEVFKSSFGPDGVIRGSSGNVSSTVYPLSDDEDPCDEGEDKVLKLQEDRFSLFFKDRQMKIRTRLIGKMPHTERRIKEVVEPSGKSLAGSKDKTNGIKAEFVAKLLGPLVMFGMLGLRLKELFDQAKSESPRGPV